MQIHKPFLISARLCPGIKIGEGILSLKYHGPDLEGRQVYTWFLDFPNTESYEGYKELRSGCGESVDHLKMFGTLAAFLLAAAEAYRYRSDDDGDEQIGGFHPDVAEWAYQNQSEIELFEEEMREGGFRYIED